MGTYPFLAVTQGHALRFFFEHLRDLSEHHASDSEAAVQRQRPRALRHHVVCLHGVSGHADNARVRVPALRDGPESARGPAIMEAAASQCLLLTGFFGAQLRGRHNVDWYASLGAGFYVRAAGCETDAARADMMRTMAQRFAFWRQQQARLAQELHDRPLLLLLPSRYAARTPV
jgi:hypothetical protein